MCGALTPEELTRLAAHTRKSHVDAGNELAGEATPVDSYANVMKGVVKLTKGLDDGRQQVVGLQFAPDLLGRLFAREHPTSAEAATDVELCVVPRPALEQMIATTPAMEHRLMQQALRELDDARDWMVTLGRKTATEKIATFLVLIADHSQPGHASGAARSFELPLSRSDIADFLGLTIETVSRQITRLRGLGVIHLSGTRQVDVPDMDRLRAMAG